MGLYQGSCGTGQVIGASATNNQITVSPSTTSNYYVRAEGGLCPASKLLELLDVYTLETRLSELEDICEMIIPFLNLKEEVPQAEFIQVMG